MNEIVLRDFFQTANQDDVYAPNCIISKFVHCSPQKQLGLIIPASEPNACTDGLSGGGGTGPGNVVTTAFLPYSLDRVYTFLADGSVYNLDLDGTPSTTSLHTRTPAAGSNACYNVIEYNGYIYYAMEDRLGRLDPATNTFNDNFAVFSRGESAVYHPMWIVNDTLYIGDADYIAQVDTTGTFVGNALDIEPDFRVTSLFEWNNQLVIGAQPKRNGTSFNERKKSYAKIYRWNTWSVSFDTAIMVPEYIVHGFLVADGALYVLAQGEYTRIYQYGEPFCRYITDIPTGTIETNPRRYNSFYPMAVHHIGGTSYFAIGYDSGGVGVEPGIYSFRTRSPGSAPTVQMETAYRGYAGAKQEQYYCVNSLPGFGLFWSYSESANPSVDNNGIDYWRFGGLAVEMTYWSVTTGVIRLDRRNMKDFRVEVMFGALPLGTSLSMTAFLNGTASGTQYNAQLRRDDDRDMFYTPDLLPACTTLQLRLDITNNSPGAVPAMLDEIRISFD